ncbi:MAG: hypothetical protein E7813_00150 [Bradyrhizobium sp.]|uniref:hypothetical protein n=1 Tax=Bradyrhizobium sp. TaxID=376 RepID=UPI0011F49B12|nr:hypothetical protein [Bradyrhizobium sp.]THD76155.1 MAG: hypothetical protein E7813_00150 [Bradyrhizobium sp.]
MAQAKRKHITGYAKTVDADLFKLHDRFCDAYAAMKKHDTPTSSEGSGGNATKEQKAAFRKWESAAGEAFKRAKAVIDAPALTLEGMLMKFHVAGFVITDSKPGTFTGPYQSGIRRWAPNRLAGDNVEIIVSLRDDLHRLVGTTR